MTFSPKSQWCSSGERREKLAQLVADPVIPSALTHALADIAYHGATAEQMVGARKIIDAFLGLSDPLPEPPARKSRSLPTYSPGYVPPPKDTEKPKA